MSRRLLFVLSCLTPLLLGASASAGVYEGWTAARRGDYATALAEFRRLAEEGNFVAQYNLGIMYANGQGVPRDLVEAATWFDKAAKGGDARAQFNLGNMYARGQGVPQDLSRAADWYAKAAEQGLADAQYGLGRLYYMGAGVKRDLAEAYVWMQLAADQGVTLAEQALSVITKTLEPGALAGARERVRAWQANHARLSAAPQ